MLKEPVHNIRLGCLHMRVDKMYLYARKNELDVL